MPMYVIMYVNVMYVLCQNANVVRNDEFEEQKLIKHNAQHTCSGTKEGNDKNNVKDKQTSEI